MNARGFCGVFIKAIRSDGVASQRSVDIQMTEIASVNAHRKMLTIVAVLSPTSSA